MVTASLDVAQALRGHAGVSVDVLGGRLDRESQTLTGVATVEQLRRLRPDVCLMSPCGLDVDDGLTLRAREEAQVVAAMIERARRTIVLAGEAKLGTAGPYVVAPAERVDVLVTDAPEERVAPFRELGLEVVDRMTGKRADERGLRRLHPQRLRVRELGVADPAGPRRARAQPAAARARAAGDRDRLADLDAAGRRGDLAPRRRVDDPRDVADPRRRA